MFVVVDAVDRPHGLVSVAEVEDSLGLLDKIDFEFLSSELLAGRLEAIAVNLYVVSVLLGVVGEIGGKLPPMGKDVYCRRIRFFLRQNVGGEKRDTETQTLPNRAAVLKAFGVSLSDHSNHN